MVIRMPGFLMLCIGFVLIAFGGLLIKFAESLVINAGC